MKLLYRKLYIY